MDKGQIWTGFDNLYNVIENFEKNTVASYYGCRLNTKKIQCSELLLKFLFLFSESLTSSVRNIMKIINWFENETIRNKLKKTIFFFEKWHP
jgi:hypothetical protein